MRVVQRAPARDEDKGADVARSRARHPGEYTRDRSHEKESNVRSHTRGIYHENVSPSSTFYGVMPTDKSICNNNNNLKKTVTRIEDFKNVLKTDLTHKNRWKKEEESRQKRSIVTLLNRK